MIGTLLVSCSCVACNFKSCVSRAVCSSMRFCRRFLEIRFAELRLLLIAVPLERRGLSLGDRRGIMVGCLVVLKVLLFGSSWEGSTVGRFSDVGVGLELVWGIVGWKGIRVGMWDTVVVDSGCTVGLMMGGSISSMTIGIGVFERV